MIKSIKKHEDNDGFTLIELLAIIIILAVIMVFAVPALLDTANTARKKSTELYAERVGAKALEKATSDDTFGLLNIVEDLTQVPEVVVYQFKDDLNFAETGKYFGCVQIFRDSDKISGFNVKVYLSDGKYCTPSWGVEMENISSFEALLDGETKGNETSICPKEITDKNETGEYIFATCATYGNDDNNNDDDEYDDDCEYYGNCDDDY